MVISINERDNQFVISGKGATNVVGVIRGNSGIDMLKFDNIKEEVVFAYDSLKYRFGDIMAVYEYSKKLVNGFVK